MYIVQQRCNYQLVGSFLHVEPVKPPPPPPLHLRLPAAVAELTVASFVSIMQALCPSLLCAYVTLFVAKFADVCDSMSLLLEGVAVSVSGTRVFKSKEPRGRRVVEALVVGTLGCVKLLHSSTPTCSPGRVEPWENIWYCTGIVCCWIPFGNNTKKNIRHISD